MNLGLPILAFDCVYNRATTEEKCLYWKNAEKLEKLVVETLENTAEREKIALAMLEVGKRLYTWKVIADKYIAQYNALLR